MAKDTFYSLTPVNWYLRSMAMSNIYQKDSQLKESGSIIKSTIYILAFGLFNIICLCYKIEKFNGSLTNGIVRFSDSVQMAYWISYIEYIIDMGYVFTCGRIKLLRYFEGYENIDSILGFPCYDEIRKTIISTLISSASIFCFVSVFDYVCWVLIVGWKVATVCSVDYLYFVLSMFTILDIFAHVIQVEYRLKHIRELLQNGDTPNIIERFIENGNTKISVRPLENKSMNTLKTLCDTRYFETSWFIKCYLLLLEQVAYINTSYGFRVLVYCINLLINMINLLNLAIRVFNGSMHPTCTTGVITILASVSSAMRALNYGIVIIILMYRCEQAYKQCDKLLETIDGLMTSKNNCSSLKADFIEFRNLIITRPVKFHAAKFFTMDYTVLVSLSSVVVTYTIIMLQSMQ